MSLLACNGGGSGGISEVEINHSTIAALSPGPAWQRVAPLGVPILYSGIVPNLAVYDNVYSFFLIFFK